MKIQIGSKSEIAKLNILSVNKLAFTLNIKLAKLVEIARTADSYYAPFEITARSHPFQKHPPKGRLVDNPLRELKKIQKRIYRQLLKPICFPDHIFGGVPKRSVLDNAKCHVGPLLLVTIDVRKCFPSITNKQIYEIWRHLLGCSPRVARLLTRSDPELRKAFPPVAALLFACVQDTYTEIAVHSFGTRELSVDQMFWTAGATLEAIGKSIRQEPFDLGKGRVNVELLELVRTIRSNQTKKLTPKELRQALEYAGYFVADEEALRLFEWRSKKKGQL